MLYLRIFQNFLISISLILIVFLALFSAFGHDDVVTKNIFYQISFVAVFLVMIIRPLADIFSGQKWLRKLVFLRKGFGILSAAIIVGFVFGDIIAPHSDYIRSMFTARYWSIQNCLLFAHLGDITGLILLITSNNLSMIILKKNWKRVQKLAYVYFYAGGLYEMCASNSAFAFYAMLCVIILVVIAFFMNRRKSTSQTLQQTEAV